MHKNKFCNPKKNFMPKKSFSCLKMFQKKKKLNVQKPNFTIQIRKFNEMSFIITIFLNFKFYYNFYLVLNQF
jgi:hypothetical protein